MEEFANKIQEEIASFDKMYLRKIQGDMFRCSAKCTDNLDSSQVEMNRCLEKCAKPAMNADQFLQSEMQDIQDRIQRCAKSCADKIKDKSIDGQPSAKARDEMEACVGKCGDEMIKLLPTITKRMKTWFEKGSYNN